LFGNTCRTNAESGGSCDQIQCQQVPYVLVFSELGKESGQARTVEDNIDAWQFSG
jgi:hypothetical protein